MLSPTNKSQISELFLSIDKDDEFEIMFNNYKQDNPLPLVDFMNVMKYIKHKSDAEKLELKETIQLDVFYTDYRITIDGMKTINDFLGLVHQRKNNNIISILVSQYLDKDGFTLIRKEKDVKNKIDIDTVDIRFRKSNEKDITDQKIC